MQDVWGWRVEYAFYINRPGDSDAWQTDLEEEWGDGRAFAIPHFSPEPDLHSNTDSTTAWSLGQVTSLSCNFLIYKMGIIMCAVWFFYEY